MLVEAFVAEPAVEGLDESVVDWFPRPDELELDAPAVSPGVERAAVELGSVVDHNRPRQAARRGKPLEHVDHSFSAEAYVDLDRHALARARVDDLT